MNGVFTEYEYVILEKGSYLVNMICSEYEYYSLNIFTFFKLLSSPDFSTSYVYLQRPGGAQAVVMHVAVDVQP